MLLSHPTGQQQIHLRKVLNEHPKTLQRDLQTIKEWLLKQPHLPDTWDEHCLLTFLRGCKFSLETCKRKLDTYFTVRAALPEFFTNRDISRTELRSLFDIADAAVLPNLTPDGARVSVVKVFKTDFETPNPADLFKLVFMVGDIRLQLEEGVVDTYIMDLDFSFSKHFLNAVRINPTAIKNGFECIQEAYPVVIKEVHLINAPSFVDFAINFLKPFMSETLRNSIFVHTNVETLYNFVPKEVLPQDYGGHAGKLEDLKNNWLKALEDYSLWFERQETIKADESKRKEKTNLQNSYCGIEGSFRELDFD